MCYSCNSFPSETFKFIKATIPNRAANSDSMLETYLITRGDVNKAVFAGGKPNGHGKPGKAANARLESHCSTRPRPQARRVVRKYAVISLRQSVFRFGSRRPAAPNADASASGFPM